MESGDPTARLSAVLRRAPMVMEALRAARDVDIVFFDPADLTPERDRSVEAALRAAAPHLPWHAKNQAAVHRWYPRRFGIDVPPLRSSAEGVGTFPETASSVGVRLLDGEEMLVVAPHGLDDLFGCVCRHNPTRVSASWYERRIDEKGWRGRWPRMRYVAPVTIRPWEARDREPVQALLRLLSPDARVSSDEAPVYVAESGNVVVGMVTLCVFSTLTGPKAHLDHLVVSPERRRQGIGRALVRHAIERARAAGASRIDLTANETKDAGRALYRSLGFQLRSTGSFRLGLG